jgi:hypothetical protein
MRRVKRMSNAGLLRVLAAVAALGTASPAAAGPGNGIRLGGSDGRLHPFLELETRSDSNVYFAVPGAKTDDLVLHVRPGLVVAAPGDLAAVDLRAALDWAQYLGVGGDTAGLSRLYGDASLGVGLNRRGTVGLELGDRFRRSASTDALSFGSAVISNFNALRLAVPWKPGGGALLVTVGGEWQLETFEPYLAGVLCDDPSFPACDTDRLADLGYSELRGTGEVRWKFLPRTAGVLDVSWFARLPNDAAIGDDVSGLRALTGLTGLVSARLAATVKAGYGDTFGSAEEGFRTWLANVELEWLATETASVRGGYLHDFGSDPARGALFSTNRLYTEARMLVGGRTTLRLLGDLERRGYELADDVTTSLLRVEPSVEYEVVRPLRVAAGYAFTSRSSDLPAGTPALPGFDYDRSEAFLRLALTY